MIYIGRLRSLVIEREKKNSTTIRLGSDLEAHNLLWIYLNNEEEQSPEAEALTDQHPHWSWPAVAL